MTVALIDNGSLEPAATLNLHAVASALSDRAGFTVHALSWKHSDRLTAADLDGDIAWTLVPWMTMRLAAGERDFLFVPFFISPQGAIGSALRNDLEKLQTSEAPFTYSFTESLAEKNIIPQILAWRIRETIKVAALSFPPVVFVDHGGPSSASSELRNRFATETRALLRNEVGLFAAASMEGGEHIHSRPLLSDQLLTPGFSTGDVVIALLFLSPGRHAGPGGDVAQICGAAEAQAPGLQCHLTDLIGTHPLAVDALFDALRAAYSHLPPTHLS